MAAFFRQRKVTSQRCGIAQTGFEQCPQLTYVVHFFKVLIRAIDCSVRSRPSTGLIRSRAFSFKRSTLSGFSFVP